MGAALQAQPTRALIVEAPAGTRGPLDPLDLLRAENPAQEFLVEVREVQGRTSAQADDFVQFEVRSERAGYVTLLNQNPEGTLTFLYPNPFAANRTIAANQWVRFPDDRSFRIQVTPPFGLELVKVLVTPEPLVSQAALDRASQSRSLVVVEGEPTEEGTTDLNGLDPAAWGVATMRMTTVGPPSSPSARSLDVPAGANYYSNRPVERWRTVYGERVGPTRSVGTPPRAQPPAVEGHTGEIIVIGRRGRGSRSFGDPLAVGSMFSPIRVVDPSRDSRDASGTRSLFETHGTSFDEVLASLNADPDVVAAFPNYRVATYGSMVATDPPTAADPDPPSPPSSATPDLWDLQWGLHNAFWRTPRARVDVRWREGMEDYRAPSTPTIVAVIDTGIRMDTPHLDGYLWRNPKERINGIDDDNNGCVDDLYGCDFVDGDADPTDPNRSESHGTFVASLITGASTQTIGLAPDVRIMPIRALDVNGRGTIETVIQAIGYAVKSGAKVINLSLGQRPLMSSDEKYDEGLAQVFADAREAGILIVMAAGNDGIDGNSFTVYPSHVRAPNTLSVAALDLDGELASFSNYGRADLAAPGTHILGHTGSAGVCSDDGTSMAAPYVSAAAALLWAASPNLTPDAVRETLFGSVTTIPGLPVRSGGLLNIEAALR
ncbi:MAG: S8 family serine peptidase [Bacteroidota bacterium]